MSEFAGIIKGGQSEREQGLQRERKQEFPKISDELKKAVDALCYPEQQCLLAMCMESIRGSWSFPEKRLSVIHYLCEAMKNPADKGSPAKWNSQWVLLPTELLDAIKHNAFIFNGHMIDGRIFRDGDRASGLTGNISYAITGDDRIKQQGFAGTYYEVWAYTAFNSGGINLVYTMKDAYKILRELDDLTFDDLLA